jgi:hypothetical protein
MRFAQAPVLSLSFALLAGCVTVGRDFDTTHANEIRAAEHDKAQIKAWFGAPRFTTTFARNGKGCVERWRYEYATATLGASGRAKALVVDFDGSGRVCDYAFSTGS